MIWPSPEFFRSMKDPLDKATATKRSDSGFLPARPAPSTISVAGAIGAKDPKATDPQDPGITATHS